MEAPNKLYLNQDDGLIWHCRSYKDDIEYTRTDAFIEKAVDYIANNMQCSGYTMQTKSKFISKFKKYMHG